MKLPRAKANRQNGPGFVESRRLLIESLETRSMLAADIGLYEYSVDKLEFLGPGADHSHVSHAGDERASNSNARALQRSGRPPLRNESVVVVDISAARGFVIYNSNGREWRSDNRWRNDRSRVPLFFDPYAPIDVAPQVTAPRDLAPRSEGSRPGQPVADHGTPLDRDRVGGDRTEQMEGEAPSVPDLVPITEKPSVPNQSQPSSPTTQLPDSQTKSTEKPTDTGPVSSTSLSLLDLTGSNSRPTPENHVPTNNDARSSSETGNRQSVAQRPIAPIVEGGVDASRLIGSRHDAESTDFYFAPQGMDLFAEVDPADYGDPSRILQELQEEADRQNQIRQFDSFLKQLADEQSYSLEYNSPNAEPSDFPPDAVSGGEITAPLAMGHANQIPISTVEAHDQSIMLLKGMIAMQPLAGQSNGDLDFGNEIDVQAAAWSNRIGMEHTLSANLSTGTCFSNRAAQRESTEAADRLAMMRVRPWLASATAAFGGVFVALRRFRAKAKEEQQRIEQL